MSVLTPVLRQLGLALLVCLAVLAPVRANPVLLVDMDDLTVLQSEDAGRPWHPASLTKLMTAFVAFEQIGLGRLGLDTPVVISPTAIAQPPSRSGLAVGTTISLEDALYILIVKSANDVAVAIAETVAGTEPQFVAMMNDAARRMNLTGTNFVNAHGLHDPAQISSARDLALLALYVSTTYPQYSRLFTTEAVTVGSERFESNNELLLKLAGTTGMKTGYVCASGLNIVATIERNGRRLLAVVLGASSARERNQRTAQMLLAGASGEVPRTGQPLLGLANQTGVGPVDMRSRICGAEADAYVASQRALYPMGLPGQPDFLTETVAAQAHTVVALGRVRTDFPFPLPPLAGRPSTPTDFSLAGAVAAAPVAETTLSGEGDLMARPEAIAAPRVHIVPMPRPRPGT